MAIGAPHLTFLHLGMNGHDSSTFAHHGAHRLLLGGGVYVVKHEGAWVCMPTVHTMVGLEVLQDEDPRLVASGPGIQGTLGFLTHVA